MNSEIFAEWLRGQGHRVLKTPSSYWYNAGPGVLQAFPYDQVIEPSEAELQAILQSQKAICLRFSCPITSALGRVSYHVVWQGADYDFNHVHATTRNKVRRALKLCSVGPIAFERLAEEGWELYSDTLARQRRRTNITRESWESGCLLARRMPGFEPWGTVLEGKLAACMLTVIIDDCCYYLNLQSRGEYLSTGVNNVLLFAATRTIVTRPGVRSVFSCLHSLDASFSMDQFKFRLGFVAKPVRQRVVFHPLLAPFVNGFSHALLRVARRMRPQSATVAKAEGLMRFCLEGQLPLHEQTAPEGLRYAPAGTFLPTEPVTESHFPAASSQSSTVSSALTTQE
jgi:hypothetical protein